MKEFELRPYQKQAISAIQEALIHGQRRIAIEMPPGFGKGIVLPPFSCHSLRHTFTTRLCESGINVKVIQDVLGHADISTTMDIYCDVTKDLKQKEFTSLAEFFKDQQI